eukprot:scaffold301864_cov36-Prasinocladus_malaysianus.AAC.1
MSKQLSPMNASTKPSQAVSLLQRLSLIFIAECVLYEYSYWYHTYWYHTSTRTGTLAWALIPALLTIQLRSLR